MDGKLDGFGVFRMKLTGMEMQTLENFMYAVPLDHNCGDEVR